MPNGVAYESECVDESGSETPRVAQKSVSLPRLIIAHNEARYVGQDDMQNLVANRNTLPRQPINQ